MRREAVVDLRVVRRSVAEVGVVVIEGEEVDGDVARDRGARVQQHRVDAEVRNNLPVVRRIRRYQIRARAPHAARQQGSASVDFSARARATSRRVLHGVVRVTNARGADLETNSKLRFIGHQHANDIAKALAVRALARAGAVDEVVAVLVVHNHAERSVVAASTRWVEVDRHAVVERVAGTSDLNIDGPVGLRSDGRKRGVVLQRVVANLVRLDVRVDFRALVLDEIRGVVHELKRATRAALSHRAHGSVGNVNDREPASTDRRHQRNRRGSSVWNGHISEGVGVKGRRTRDNLAVGDRSRSFGIARIRGGSRGCLALDAHIHISVADLILLKEDLVGLRVDDIKHALARSAVKHARAGHDVLVGQTGFLGRRVVVARPDHLLLIGDDGARAELIEGQARGFAEVKLRWSDRTATEVRRKGAHILEGVRDEHQRIAGLVAYQAAHISAENRHAVHMLGVADQRELVALVGGIKDERKHMRAVAIGADR